MFAASLEIAFRFLEFLWMSFLVLAPMMMLGLLLGGMLHVFISRNAVFNWLRRDNLKSVVTSAAIGVPVPLCSCSVVPVVSELRRKGASRSSCMSFLITAPETGADSILVTNAFFGLPAAVGRPVISFLTAVLAGLCCLGLIGKERPGRETGNADRLQQKESPHCCGSDDTSHSPLFPGRQDCYISPGEFRNEAVLWFRGLIQRVTAGRCEAGSGRQHSGLRRIVAHIFRYGFVEIADDILFALLIGIVLGGVLYLLIPSSLLTHEHARWVAYPVMVLVGTPIYICASASTPIAAALVANGLSPGAALVFLMTGPATNTSTMTIILNQFGGRFASIYIGSVMAVTVVFGVMVDLLILATGYSITVNLGPSEAPAIQFLQWIVALALAALIVWRFRAGALKRGWQNMLMNARPIPGR